jgi:hypothetical protein
MIKLRLVLTCLSFLVLCIPIADAGESGLKLVTATGRAAIISNEQIQETRTRALEDALYSAALLGGAEIDGFSSVQAGTQLDDHFVVRPSSKIIDYDVVSEQFDDLHYSVIIEAAVGELEKADCRNRLSNNVTMFAPVIVVDETIPAWLSHQPSSLVKSLYEELNQKPNIEMINRAASQLKPEELTRDHTYNYKALTAGTPKVFDGNFAFATKISIKRTVQKTAFQQNHFADVVVESSIFVDSDFKSIQKVMHQTRVPIRNILPTKFMSVLVSPNQTKIIGELLKLMSKHAAELTNAMLCTPLSATMVARDDGLHIQIGTRQGLENNRLAFVTDKSMPWTVLRVVELNMNSAVLKPLNRQRTTVQLNGKTVSFMEFN